jgi:hypothetical protein
MGASWSRTSSEDGASPQATSSSPAAAGGQAFRHTSGVNADSLGSQGTTTRRARGPTSLGADAGPHPNECASASTATLTHRIATSERSSNSQSNRACRTRWPFRWPCQRRPRTRISCGPHGTEHTRRVPWGNAIETPAGPMAMRDVLSRAFYDARTQTCSCRSTTRCRPAVTATVKRRTGSYCLRGRGGRLVFLKPASGCGVPAGRPCDARRASICIGLKVGARAHHPDVARALPFPRWVGSVSLRFALADPLSALVRNACARLCPAATLASGSC